VRSSDHKTGKRRDRRIVVALTAVLTVGAALSSTACGGSGSGQGALHGRGGQLFVNNCGSCHTLAAAGTRGTVGPDLDALLAGRRRDDLDQVVRDQIDTGGGAMPAGILTDGDADAVAGYVASAIR
jgi:mono/diheme cytochrome c family protein